MPWSADHTVPSCVPSTTTPLQIFVKNKGHDVAFNPNIHLTYFVQTMLLVTFGLSWHCQDRWSVAPQFVHGGN